MKHSVSFFHAIRSIFAAASRGGMIPGHDFESKFAQIKIGFVLAARAEDQMRVSGRDFDRGWWRVDQALGSLNAGDANNTSHGCVFVTRAVAASSGAGLLAQHRRNRCSQAVLRLILDFSDGLVEHIESIVGLRWGDD